MITVILNICRLNPYNCYLVKPMQQLNETSHDLNPSQSNKYDFDPIEELQLKVNKSNKEDYQQIVKILTTVLTYPSSQLAQLHMHSDRLGKRDLMQQVKQRTKSDKEGMDERNNLQFCPCCGFVKQDEEIKLCTRLNKINNIGISTFLYFETIKNLVILLVIMTLLYSIYALATNLIASGIYQQLIRSRGITSSLLSTVSYVSLSLGSKQLNQTVTNKNYYYIQCWIGVGMITVWLLMFFMLKYFEREKEIQVQEETISASDFSISLQNVPKDITKQELQAQLNQYYETLSHIPEHHKKPFKIVKINVGKPFYLNEADFQDEELDKLRERHNQLIQKFVQLIKERTDSATFSTIKQRRDEMYAEFQEILQKQMAKYQELGQKIEKKIKTQTTDDQARTTAFVTFQTSRAMRLITRLNDPSILAKIRYYITCCQGHHKFQFLRSEQDMQIKIERAPEPEDIIWTNLGVPACEIIKRKFITFTATALLLGASFGIVYGLSKAQQSKKDNQLISLAISVCLSVMNILIGLCIRYLSSYEKDYTLTKYQTSLAVKSILAALINSILIPIIVNYYIKVDIYGKNGLASDVFMLGLTNSFVAPVLKIIDISYIINRLLKWWANRPYNKLTSNQRALNETFQLLIFEVGYQYVYLVSLFIFTCFFVSLQPIISIFAFCGMGLMYWTQKYSLFNKMKRPVPGTDLVNVTMFQIILFGGIAYSLGSLTWSNFMPGGIPREALLPNLIACGVSVVMILMPYNAILAGCLSDTYSINQQFQESRILLPSQYDRLNPATSQQGLKDFQEFYEKKVKSIQNGSEQDKLKFFELFAKQGARGQQKPSVHMHQNPLSTLFQGAPQSGPAPQMLISSLIPGSNTQGPSPFMGLITPPQQFQQFSFQTSFAQQQFSYRPPPMMQMPGPRPPMFMPQSGFIQPMQQMPPQPRPQPGFSSPMVPMPGPSFTPNNQQMGFGPRPPGFQPQPQGFGFQQVNANVNQGFGFQQPRPQGYGFVSYR